MKSELTTVQPKANGFPKPMRRKDHSNVILATMQAGGSLTGMVVWAVDEAQIGEFSREYNSNDYIDLPRTECVILSNQ